MDCVAISTRSVLHGLRPRQHTLAGSACAAQFATDYSATTPRKTPARAAGGTHTGSLAGRGILRLGNVQLTGNQHVLYTVAFSPDRTLLATGGQDSVLRLWDLHSGRVRQQFTEQKYGIHALQLVPMAELLAAAGPDGFVRIRHLETGNVVASCRAISVTPRRWPSRPMEKCWRPLARKATSFSGTWPPGSSAAACNGTTAPFAP